MAYTICVAFGYSPVYVVEISCLSCMNTNAKSLISFRAANQWPNFGVRGYFFIARKIYSNDNVIVWHIGNGLNQSFCVVEFKFMPGKGDN